MLDVAPLQNEGPKPASAVSDAPTRVRGRWRWISAMAPVLLALGVGGIGLAGLAAGWTVPKFSNLMGGSTGQADDWCAEHSVPESICVECHPELLPKAKEYGWCKKHGVQECPLCHPDIAQVKTPAAVTQADQDRAQRGLDFTDRSENNSKCKLQHRRLQFASPLAAERVGVAVGPVFQSPVSEFIAVNGEIGYDQTKVARLSSRMPGTVWMVNKQVGDRVQKGDLLALVDAAEVGRAKAELLQALAQFDLKSKVYDSVRNVPSAIPGRTIQEAETALAEARIRLVAAQQALLNLGLPIQVNELNSLSERQLTESMQFLGLPEAMAQTLDRRSTTGNLLPITAPLGGLIVRSDAVGGEAVDPSKLLFVVADHRQMWLNLDVRVEDARRLAPGQPVAFRADGKTQEVRGKVIWISTAVDEKTRTVKVRAALDNADGKLRAETFGTGRIILREEKDAVVVSKDAVHSEGCCHVVFVRDKNYLDDGAPKVFHVRKVVPGARTEQNVEIVAGLLPGEVVATRGSGILRSELLKNNLGAG